MKTEIIPAVMPRDFKDITAHAEVVRHEVQTIQLDLMDGKYVSEKTWPFFHSNDYDLEDLKKEDQSLPLWEEMNYELDLMIERPEENLETWLGIGASRVIFHYASVSDWQKIRDIDIHIRDFIQIGVGVTIHDNLDDIYNLIDDNVVDFVQVMGISHIGYQGEPFEEKSLDIITSLKEKYPELIISVDGGVSLDTISSLHNVGATRLVSGSGVYGGGVASENIKDLIFEIKGE